MSDTTESENSLGEACKEETHINAVTCPRADSSITIPLPVVYEVLKDYSRICSDCHNYIENLPLCNKTDVKACSLCNYVCSGMLASADSGDLPKNTTRPETVAVDLKTMIKTAEVIITKAEHILQSITEKLSDLNEDELGNCNDEFNPNALPISADLHQLQQNFNTRMPLNEYHGLNFSCDKSNKDSINVLIREMSISNNSESTSVAKPSQPLQEKLTVSENTDSSIAQGQADCSSSCDTNDPMQPIKNKKNVRVNGNVALEHSSSSSNGHHLNLCSDNLSIHDRVKEWIETIQEKNYYNTAFTLPSDESRSELISPSTTSSTNSLSDFNETCAENFENVSSHVNPSVQEYCNPCNTSSGNSIEVSHHVSDATSTQLDTNYVNPHFTRTKTSEDTERSSLISLLRFNVNDGSHETANKFRPVPVEQQHDDEDSNNGDDENSLSFTNEEKENL